MPAVRPIMPPKINVDAISRAIIKMKEAKGKEIVKWLEATVRTWESKPTFKAKLDFRGDDVVITIEIRGSYFDVRLWTWLDEGVPGHTINATGDSLGFPNRDPNVGGRMYVQETFPGKLVSRPGANNLDDGPFHAPESVDHPGIEARDWTGTVRQMMIEAFGKRARAVFKKVITDEGW